MADADGRRELMRFNLVMGATAGVVILFFVLASVWGSGAVQQSSEEGDNWWEVPLHERHKMDLDFTGLRSQLPVNGTYNWTGPSEFFIEVDLPPSEQDAGYPGPALMHVALWLPDVIPIESMALASVSTYLARLTTPSELGGPSIYVRGLKNH